jgi:hypothetical protein
VKYIGNIVSDLEFSINRRFNFVKTYDDIIVGIPTLILGYKEIQTIEPDFNILNHRINDNLFWTFKKNEKRDKFNQVVIEFVEYCFNKLVNDVEYIYIDPITYSKESLGKISSRVSQVKNPVGILINDRVIYIYGEKLIFGIDLELCELAGINKEKLTKKYEKLVGGFLDYDKIFIEYGNDIVALNDSIRYLPFLYSIDNE